MFEHQKSCYGWGLQQLVEDSVIDGHEVSVEVRVACDVVAELNDDRGTFMTR